MAFKGKTSGRNSAWHLDEADDPADWNDEFSFLRHLDASLRCELCYNILSAPVAVKDCNHVFCSVCVRVAINQPDPYGQHCPKCMMKNVHDSSLVPQPIVETAAEAWKLARPELFKRQSQKKEQNGYSSHSPESSSKRPSKRVRMNDESSDVEEIQNESDSDDGRLGQPPSSSIPLKTNGSTNEGQDKDYRSMQAGDMVDCPVCSHSFTLVALHQHLDKGCNPGDPEPSPKDRGLPTVKGVATTGGGSSWFQRPSNTSSSKNDGSTTGGSPAPRKKLARPNYSFVKDPEIRKLLEEFKLATSGSKERLVDRHRHWVSLYNANLDANEKLQKNDVQLRKEMAVWERGQEEGLKRSKSKMASMTEEKALAWQETNEAQFRDLEKKARETHFKNKAAHQQIRTQQEESHEEAATGVLSGNST